MGHTHVAEEKNVYYLDQLCTIGFCGALGLVQILLWNYGVLNIILDPKFHIPVLLSGIVLTALAVVRGVSLWKAVGQAKTHHHDHACDHDHDHGYEHVHEHSHEHGIIAAGHAHAHDHGHEHGVLAAEHSHAHVCDHEPEPAHEDCGHEHGWAPWRYVVLLLPLLLFLLGMPWPAPAVADEPLPEGDLPVLGASTVGLLISPVGQGPLLAACGLFPGRTPEAVLFVGFQELQQAAYTPESRKFWDGQLVRVKGQFGPTRDDKKFRLFRMKMTCCAADAYPLNVEIECPESLPIGELENRWVNVTGVIHFRKAGREEYITVMELRSAKDVRLSGPDPNLFLTS